MKLSHIQEARYHRDHPMIDEIKQAAKDRKYYERKITNISIEEVISMLTRHFGEPRYHKEDSTIWDMNNDELEAFDHGNYIKIYLA